MGFSASKVVEDYLTNTLDIFTANDFYHYLKVSGIKISKEQVVDLLHSSDLVFSLINNEFITRAGVFVGRWFSFKPTKEEIQKGHIILGHRCMPFLNPEVNPDSFVVVSHQDIIKDEACTFSMNLAMDTFSLFGEGYVLPYILNDRANTTISVSSLEYNMPTEVTLTSWSLKDISPNYQFEFGDRFLCRVVNWEDSVIELFVLKNDMKELAVSESALAREDWYSYFEKGLLDNFNRHGPVSSIEEQLALLYLECQEELCIKYCGSAEEFFKHTKKIGFSQFGVETRIWREGEEIPYIGEWNRRYADSIILSDMSMTFSPYVMDAYIENNIYEELSGEKNLETIEQLTERILPSEMRITQTERRSVLLNIEKRHAILKKEYNNFSEQPIVVVRKQILDLFTQITHLLCSIGCSGLKIEKFPQQEMIILSQLFSHIVRLLEEIQNTRTREYFPVNDVMLSVEGMEETFFDINSVLTRALEDNRSNSFVIVGSDKQNR